MSANLDFLRAIAVIMVMLDHLIPTMARHGIAVPKIVQQLGLELGHAGVLAFFVHTSLVLMYSLERMGTSSRTGLVWRFYVRRAFRIYPLAVFVILGVLLLGVPRAPWHDQMVTEYPLSVILANLLLVQNLFTGQNVLVPLWSLPYEVEMYLVLPALFFLASQRAGVRLIAGLLVSSWLFGHAVYVVADGRMNLLAYIPCFLAGVLCFALRGHVRRRFSGSGWVLFVITFIAGFSVVHGVWQPRMHLYGWAYALVLAVAIPAFHEVESPTLRRVSLWLATYSYGLYLFHVPALYVVYMLWQPESIILGVVSFFVLTMAAAVPAYHFLEAPFVALGRRLSEDRRPLAPTVSTPQTLGAPSR